MSVAIVGTLDTKGEELGFVRDVIEAQGGVVHVVDTGVMGDPAFDPDTPRARSPRPSARLCGTAAQVDGRSRAIRRTAASTTRTPMGSDASSTSNMAVWWPPGWSVPIPT